MVRLGSKLRTRPADGDDTRMYDTRERATEGGMSPTKAMRTQHQGTATGARRTGGGTDSKDEAEVPVPTDGEEDMTTRAERTSDAGSGQVAPAAPEPTNGNLMDALIQLAATVTSNQTETGAALLQLHGRLEVQETTVATLTNDFARQNAARSVCTTS